MAIIWVGTGRFNAYIGPVQDYIDRVVAADVAAGNTLGLEVGVRDAYDVFIRDSINVGDLGTSGGVLSQANSIIKAASIMAGARTLDGALVPLVGTAPTNYNFVAGDYNRETGLAGNGSTKYLDSNRNNNADPQNNNHNAAYVHTAGTATRAYMGASPQTNQTGDNNFGCNIASNTIFARSRSSSSANIPNASATGLMGTSRALSSSFVVRVNGATTTAFIASQTSFNGNISVFASGGSVFTDARLAFYSIGESLDLALLDARVTTLINAIAAAIP